MKTNNLATKKPNDRSFSIAKKINLKTISRNPRFELLLRELKVRLKPAVEYFKNLTPREQHILSIGGIILGISLIFLVVTAAIDLQRNLQKDYEYMQTYRMDAEELIKEYKEIIKLTPNEFDKVKLEQIKGDVIQALNVKEPDVTLIENKLSITIPDTQFTGVIILLNQFRKSYGIFPNKLKITRLSNSGYVSFNATFNVEQE
jgi:type II secretory pathway component PulM